MGERVTECEQVKAILVERHDAFLQIVFRDVVHPGVVFHLARIYGGVLECLCIVVCFVLRDKARNVVHMKMRQVDKPDAVGVDPERGEAAHELPAESSEACIEQDVLAVHFHEERAHTGRDAIGHVQAVVERVAGVAEERARVQLVARVVLNPGDARPVCEGYGFRAFDLRGIPGPGGVLARSHIAGGCLGTRNSGICRCGSFNARSICGGGLGVAAGNNRECQCERAERDKKLVHGTSCMVEYITTFGQGVQFLFYFKE